MPLHSMCVFSIADVLLFLNTGLTLCIVTSLNTSEFKHYYFNALFSVGNTIAKSILYQQQKRKVFCDQCFQKKTNLKAASCISVKIRDVLCIS